MYPPATLFNLPEVHADQRTLAVLGHYRGGTSMMAGLLRVFGVFMGDQIQYGNNEDVEFQRADAKKVLPLVAKRNAEHDVWGWKYPGLYLTGSEWCWSLRNPYYVAVLRDVVACAQGEVWRGQYKDVFATVRLKHEQQSVMLDFLGTAIRMRRPVMLVSYDRALVNPELLVDQLAQFAGIELDAAARGRAIASVMPERGHGDPFSPPAERSGLEAAILSNAKKCTVVGAE